MTKIAPPKVPLKNQGNNLLKVFSYITLRSDKSHLQVESSDEVEWLEIIETARSAQVFCFLCSSLRKNNYNLPHRIRPLLERYLNTDYFFTLRVIFEVNRVNKILQDFGIDCINFKGVALSQVVYQSLHSRNFSDIDILVSDENYILVKKVLLAHGYKVLESLPLDTEIKNEQFSKFFGEYTIFHPKGNICIDVHRHILGPGHLTFPLPSDRFWRRRIKISIGGQEIWTLCPSDTLLYLCMNGLKDDWQSLRTVCDISELIRNHPNLHWRELIEEASFLKILRPLLLGILVSRYLLSTPIPNEILQIAEHDSRLVDVAMGVCHRLRARLNGNTSSASLSILWMKWVVLSEKGAKIRYLIGVLRKIWNLSFSINHRDTENIKLPSSLSFLYYFIRIFRIFRNPFNAIKLILK